MDNEQRALSIFWLDGGLHPARSIAQRNNFSEEELEYELAIFKSTNTYRNLYEPIMREDLAKALQNYSFTGWNKHVCVRILPNKRIECIIAETRYTRKFYHAYLPDKEYVNNIFSHSVFSWQQDFFHTVGISDNFQWSSFPVEQQLNLLLDQYESETFIPYRRLITQDEDWIRNYTGCDVTPYICRAAYNPTTTTPVQSNQTTYMAAQRPAISTPANIGTPDTYGTYTLAQMIDQKMAVWRAGDGKVYRKSLSPAELTILKEQVSQKEDLRLQQLYTEGLCALTEIEKTVFVYIDPFFTKYNLQQSVLADSEVMFHAALDAALKVLTNESILFETTIPLPERIAGKERFTGMLLGILNPKSTDVQKDIQVTNIRNLLNEYGHDITYIGELWQILVSQSSSYKSGNSYIKELFFLMEEYGFSQQDQPDHPDKPQNTTITPKETIPTSSASPAVIWEEEVMIRRAEIISRIEKKGTLDELIAQLQQTEDEITRLPQSKRPAGYPENNTLLHQLYWSGKIKTLSEVCSLIISELTTDKLAALCGNIPLS